MATAKPRVKLPDKATKGEVITIKTLVSHPMESGQRKDRKTGEKIPRMIINKFTATFNGQQVFGANIEPAVSANPYLEFTMKVEESGKFEFVWVDDAGTTYKTEKGIEVTG
ncbi:Chain E, The Soxyz Complex [Candidatus Filomicrobium marinum]|uniref:Chain E, The Soxyz Complex n=2 Tax=Filomicrobium TaxID=119044 RepID=A0A0D6JJV2_9HYPH|nr:MULTISPECIES: thiosulfate oxidation carrier complex protein SoxZ [Filomicrobium]MCV0371330.1 thiosulfate oxidation carrier complex protein SoxZ [Filomicrobium sp.]CFX56804.1 Chain E, The Soxyz Complex [Candidatus Filomicrobium marinum]CPR22253.1 Chain E, The Soxyz Complex [Candidatus Filomicrobium marinum]SDO90667.1 sulfur compound chelating protein SoxZ [Filomicrobium insigne]